MPCELEGYCAIWKDLISPGTQIAADKDNLLSSATTAEEAAKIERVYGYCAEDRLTVAKETLDDPLASREAKLGAFMSLDSITRNSALYRQT
jgi:hypothetical protein